MAPSRKKKKPASNPARGVATISTVSKTKAQGIEESNVEANSEDSKFGEQPPQASVNVLRNEIGSNVEKALHELSPDELEKQLEESTLQFLVESNGVKSKNYVARQLSRLQTERRVLRTQAKHLNTRQWLPPETIQLIMSLLDAQENGMTAAGTMTDARQDAAMLSEDDLLTKLWTLRQLLPRLGFTLDWTTLALQSLLKKKDYLDPNSFSSGKDSIWGLDECLSWLAVASNTEDLPKYESQDAQTLYERCRKPKVYATATEAGMATPVFANFRPVTPPSEANTGRTDLSPDAETLSSSQSESDSDLEPEELVQIYLALHTRLYEISPESIDGDRKRQKNAKAISSKDVGYLDPNAKRTIARLTAKVSKIKSDILFDEDEAKRRWAETQSELVKHSAERRKLGISNADEQAKHKVRRPSMSKTTENESQQTDEDLNDILGNFFTSLPDSTTHLATGASSMSTTDPGGATVEIRDFGRSSGIKPRRVLEDAIRARDSSARITFKLVSASAFSNRHSLEVAWSREQDYTPAAPIDSLLCEVAAQTVKLEMVSIACPDATQSEAYISTVALFLIFAPSPKEEKIYLRLASSWRDLYLELLECKKEQDDAKDRDVLRKLRSMMEEFDDSSIRIFGNGSRISSANSGKRGPETQVPTTLNTPSEAQPEAMKALWEAKIHSTSYQQMLQSRRNLPIWSFKEDLLLAIQVHQVVIICGETGCGKSTQVPAYILEHELSSGRSCKVYCTEPRRISAISLARRVSEELGEKKGDVGTFRSLVGYAVRLESQITSQTRLVYATTGIVMRMLEGSGGLGEITHLVLDEVHERSIDSDFLLVVLRKLLLRRADLKVVLMSATVDAQRFSKYLDQAPILNVPGRTFPVETKYLEDAIETTRFNPAASTGGKYGDLDDNDDDRTPDASAKTSLSADTLRNYTADTCNALLKFDEYRLNYDLVIKLLVTIATTESYSFYSKAILVFLPGIGEIRRLNDLVHGHPVFHEGWSIHALHSTIAIEEQERAFNIPPGEIRKIVLATNIAETGITIPDVTCVIDTGKHKEMRFDERRQLSRLIEAFISRANAKQRRGRAGRVQKGLCFHLFTKIRHDNILPEEQTPEILRLSLQDLVLRVKICKLGGIEHTLSEALDPPSSKNIRRAVDSLVDIKALTAMEDLTPLGRQLARLPLDVFLGKLILLGSIFGCLDAMLTIAAILSSKSPFSAPMGARSQMDVARLAFKKGDSDLLTVYNAYCAWRGICSSNVMPEYQFCHKNFLSQQTLSNIEDLKAQLTTSLADTGFMKLKDSEKASLNRVRFYSRKRTFVEIPQRYNTNNDNELILNSVIAWSFYPKLLRREGKGWKNIANNQAVSLHPTSVNKGMGRPPQWLSFYHIMQSSNKFYNAHETSPVEDFAVALVCGEAEFKMNSGVIVIDSNRLRFSLDDWKTLSAIRILRTQIRQIMAQSFRNPGRAITPKQQEWLGLWEKMFSRDEKATV